MAEVAVCRHAAGIAVAPSLQLLELRGAPDDLDASARAFWYPIASTRAVLIRDPTRRAADPAEWPDVAVLDHSGPYAGLIVAGPLAARLAATVEPVLDVGEGDDYRVLVFERADLEDARRRLLEAGRPLGAMAVDLRAIELCRAALVVGAAR
jgi:hypothetical protein